MNSNICVFCGSGRNVDKKYFHMTKDFAKSLADNNFDLVYGGASIGLMGSLADEMLKLERKVYGVMPKCLVDFEVAHDDLTEFYEVDTMHTRKEKMYQISYGFVALPGGFGTLDELFEILTWKQLGLHNKKIAVYNFDGFFDELKSYVEKINREKYVSNEHFEFIQFFDDADKLMQYLKS